MANLIALVTCVEDKNSYEYKGFVIKDGPEKGKEIPAGKVIKFCALDEQNRLVGVKVSSPSFDSVKSGQRFKIEISSRGNKPEAFLGEERDVYHVGKNPEFNSIELLKK